MVKKIIFLVIAKFSERDFRRFGIATLEKNGFEVEVWDVSHIYFPHFQGYNFPSDPLSWKGVHIYKNKARVLKDLSDLGSEVFIISIMPYHPKYSSLYRASFRGVRYAAFCANAYPDAKAGNGRSARMLYYLKKLRNHPVEKIIKYGFRKLPPSLLGIKPPALILAGGTQSIRYQPPVDSMKILWIHALDYDLYLEEKDRPLLEKEQAVFLDEYLPFHPDFLLHKVEPPARAETYYPLLNTFFRLLEKELKLEVIIAAHPRSHYEKKPEFFEGRRRYAGKTIQLIKESKLVLAHSSTSLNFANLFYKPVIFLSSSELEKTYKGPLIREVANLFGKEPVLLDRLDRIDWESELAVSRPHYTNYRRAYIKTDESEERLFWETVALWLKTH